MLVLLPHTFSAPVVLTRTCTALRLRGVRRARPEDQPGVRSRDAPLGADGRHLPFTNQGERRGASTRLCRERQRRRQRQRGCRTWWPGWRFRVEYTSRPIFAPGSWTPVGNSKSGRVRIQCPAPLALVMAIHGGGHPRHHCRKSSDIAAQMHRLVAGTHNARSTGWFATSVSKRPTSAWTCPSPTGATPRLRSKKC